jgi:alpha-L-fucosidase 2
MDFGMDVRLEQPALAQGATVTTRGRGSILSQVVRSSAGQHAIVAKVTGKGIHVSSQASRLTIRSGKQADFCIFLALARGDDSARDATLRIKDAQRVGFAAIKRRHQQWWRRFWNASSIRIPDQRMLRQYHFGLYLLGSSSRQGFQMPGLQGLWYTRAPGTKWNEYTNDLNIQMNYWPIYTSNHLDLGWPYYDTVRRWLPEARKYTRGYWRCSGVQFSCCASPTGIVPPGYLTTMHWAGSAAFVAQNFWTHYLYSRDEDFLREIAYPFLKECAEFYIDFLKLDERGLYEIWPSNNPEASEGSYEAWGKNPTMDIALLKMLFHAILESAKLLAIDRDVAVKCQKRLDRLPPYPMRRGALIDMESKEFVYSHRHNGMITPIYPCADVDGKVAEKTIERFMERGRWLWGCHTVPWQAAAYARIGGGKKAYELLAEMFESYFPPHGGFNLNYNYQRRVDGIIGPAVFCNESNSGFCAALLEMLLQSHRGIIRVFPAVPRDWKDIAIKNLRAEGAFLISATRGNGHTSQVEICSTKGGILRVKNPWRTLPNVVCGGKTVNILRKRDVLIWETKPESSYLLQPHI